MPSKHFKVSDVAQKLNVSSDTIRRWEKKGLIRSTRSRRNHRLFDIDEVRRVSHKIKGISSENNYKILKDNKKTRYTSVELFAGAGGTALGLENAGINHILLNEIDNDCVETLRFNKPKWNILHEDVSKVDFKDIKVDIVQGGFPCQAFSYAGNKRGFDDTRGTLFYEFARAVKAINPKIAVGENVRGLLNHDQGRTLSTMVSVLKQLGYRVSYRVLKSQYFDVPQKRERLIIIAKRNDLNIPFAFPNEKDYIVTLGEALSDVPKSNGQQYSKSKEKVLKLVPPGGYWRDLPKKVQKDYMGKGFYSTGGRTGMARRMSWDEPSLTLTCSPAQKQTERCHPEETRPFAVREYARIQTFPDSWKFSGSITSQYKQIGNAVPVNLSYHIGKALRVMLDKKKEAKGFDIFFEANTANELPHQRAFV